jgi:hypothetical protein
MVIGRSAHLYPDGTCWKSFKSEKDIASIRHASIREPYLKRSSDGSKAFDFQLASLLLPK